MESYRGSRIPVEEESLRGLFRLNPGLSLGRIAQEWAYILTAVWLCERFWHPAVYVVTVAFIGARQHGLLVLMHDGAHGCLHPDKRWNDRVSDWLCAWPLLTSTRLYRDGRHSAHHQNIGTVDDPHIAQIYRVGSTDWIFPKKPGRLAWILLRTLLGADAGTLAKSFLLSFQGEAWSVLFARSLYYLAAVVAIVAAHRGRSILIYWVVPWATWLPLLLRFRLLSEHFGIGAHPDPNGRRTRTTLTTWWGRTFIAPNNVNYHGEHHEYPGVPFFHLPELHRLTMETPGVRERVHVTRGYWRVFRELTGARG